MRAERKYDYTNCGLYLSVHINDQSNGRNRVTHRTDYFCIMLYLVPSFEWQWFDVRFALELGL